MSEIAREPLRIAAGGKVDANFSCTVRRNRIAQLRAECIDQTAFDASRGDDEFALPADDAAVRIAPFNDHRLHRMTCMTLGEMLAPTCIEAARIEAADIEAAVRRQQRRNRDTARAEQRHPGRVRTE